MGEFSAERWALLSRHLEVAFELTEGERGRWLAALRETASDIAGDLEALLAEHASLSRERFLETSASHPFSRGTLAGTTLGAYTLVSPVGYGGMGSVWLAHRSDGRFDARAAVKLLNLPLVGRDGEERFKREGNILARLTHPNIAHLIDAGVTPSGQPYLVLEYVDGQPIDEYCGEHSLDLEARLRLILDVLAAVAHAHASLVVHRDIKPSNILVSGDGHVKLLDFGIAKLIEPDENEGAATLLTRDGTRVLTPEFAAPEQVSGAPVTAATDVYALGVLMYALLTGEHPAGDKRRSPFELVNAIARTEPLLMSVVAGPDHAALRHALRGDLDTIVAKALKKDPRERYVSVSAMAEDVRRYLGHQPVSARPDTLRYRGAKFVRRNRLTVALASAAVIAGVGGGIATALAARTARSQRDFAFRQLARAEAMNDLNKFLLSDAAPSGKPFTVNDLLARAEHVLSRQRDTSSPARIDELTSIGGQYYAQDEDQAAGRVLREAYALSRQTSNAEVRARAGCAYAAVLSRGSERPRAESLIQASLGELGPSARSCSIGSSACPAAASSRSTRETCSSV